MSKYIIDASAWIEYLDGSSVGAEVGRIVENEGNDIITSSLTIAEVYSKFIRLGRDYLLAKKAITTLSRIVLVDEEIGELAGKIHSKIKQIDKNFGMADAIIAATAEVNHSFIVSKDPHFKNFKKIVFIGDDPIKALGRIGREKLKGKPIARLRKEAGRDRHTVEKKD